MENQTLIFRTIMAAAVFFPLGLSPFQLYRDNAKQLPQSMRHRRAFAPTDYPVFLFLRAETNLFFYSYRFRDCLFRGV
jgi:hypothetical protein